MVAPQSPTNNPPLEPEHSYPPVPQFSASGRPNTRADRISFQLWIIMFLVVIMFTLINYLAMHGVAAEQMMFKPIDNIVGAGLLAAAKEFNCDLLTMGAYAHSRLRQQILGGVTRHILEHATLPVMMHR